MQPVRHLLRHPYMALTRQEPIPHQEILEVTAIIQAGAKSLQEKGRLVSLAEMMG